MSDTAPKKAAKPVKELYFLPDYGISVEATSVDDAVAQAKQLTAKDGDDNL
jgi:hypothetical protein